jgi:ABC-type transporter Mla subunit MlaD
MNRWLPWLLVPWLALASVVAHAGDLAGFDELATTLRLDPAQQAQFDVAVAATQRALLSVALVGFQLKDPLAEEIAKPRPDLGALARAQDEMVEQARPAFREARDEWARFYALLDPSQVARARAFVERKLRRLEHIGAELRGLLGEEDRR